MIRAVHVLRPDHAEHVGGDLVQLHATVRALCDEGIDAVAATREDAPLGADIVHLYNVQSPDLLVADFAWTRARYPGAKVAVSPVVWPLDVRSILRTRDRDLVLRLVRRLAKSRLTWSRCRRVLTAADAVFPNSRAELDRTTRYFRIRDRSTWTPVPNGIWLAQWPVLRGDPAGREAALRAAGITTHVRTLVACVARLETLKNQRALVEAVALVPDVALLLVGPRSAGRAGETRYVDATLERLRVALGGQGAWLGARSRTEVQELLRHVDVHVLPSFRETPGIANLEAAATGCEVVATREGSAEEYFGDAAHYAEAHSPRSIAAAIRAAVAEPRQPRLRARVEQFDWSSAGRVLAECYRSIA